MDPWYYEKQAFSQGYSVIAGVDEAGRGPLAGPVVAAAVILRKGFDVGGVADSKSISEKIREKAFGRIIDEACVGIGIVEPDEIDRINILKATHAAMRLAVADLTTACDYILVDGLPVPDLPAESLAIVKGDSLSVSISAASIVAKVTRDRIMVELDREYPEYGFAAHKGYGTREHLAALDKCGPCGCHRKSFAPVAERIFQCRLFGAE